METTPKTIEETILAEFEEWAKNNTATFASNGEDEFNVSFKELDFFDELKSFFSSSLTSLREQIAKEDVEWAEKQKKEILPLIGGLVGSVEAIKDNGYNQALSDFIAYKHNQIK